MFLMTMVEHAISSIGPKSFIGLKLGWNLTTAYVFFTIFILSGHLGSIYVKKNDIFSKKDDMDSKLFV